MVNTSSCRSIRQSKMQGFTLVEMAIVVGIVGTVLAATFAASSVVRYRMAINQASDELGITVGNIRSFYSGFQLPATITACTSPPTLTTLITNQIYPKEMWIPTAAPVTTPTVVNNPWNLLSTTSTVKAALCKGTSTEFVIRYTNIASGQCTDLLLRNSLPGRETGLVQISVNSAMVGKANTTTSATTTPLPIVPITAATACSSATANTIDWYYVLNN